MKREKSWDHTLTDPPEYVRQARIRCSVKGCGKPCAFIAGWSYRRSAEDTKSARTHRYYCQNHAMSFARAHFEDVEELPEGLRRRLLSREM